MNAKIISVCGANGSGKTTTTVNLAYSIAQRNFTVGVISSNIYYGEIQTIFGCNIPDDRGIYQALLNGETKNMFVQAGKTAVFVLSVPDKFDAIQLTAISHKRVNDIIDDAAIRFDYLIIDCDTELNNPISSIGMTVADKIITVHHPSVKDCIWQQSMQNVNNLLNLSYKTVHILNGYDKSCDLSAYKSSIGLKFEFEIGYVDNANVYANTGQAIVFHDLRQERAYISAMKALTSSIILQGGGVV